MRDKIFSTLNLNLSSSQKRSLIILVIITLAILPTIYLVKQTQILKPKAQESNIPSLTDQLLESKKAYESRAYDRVGAQSINQDPLAKMVNIATIRKDLLVKEAEVSPQLFLDQATLTDQRSNFPPQIQPLIEEKKDLEGELTIIHGDDFQNKNTKLMFQLKSAEKNYNLDFIENPPPLLTGSTAKISGVALDSEIVVPGGGQQTPPPTYIPYIPRSDITTGAQKTAVLLVNFSGDQVEPVTVNQVRQMVFNPLNSASSYFKESSFGKTWLEGDVFGWFTLQLPDTCPLYDIVDQANKLALANEIDVSTYLRRIYVITPSEKCPITTAFSGIGTIGGNPSISWIFTPNEPRTYMHEMGHNLGLHHSNSYSCGNLTIDDSRNCKESEYGDVYDIMGNFWETGSNSYQFNGPHKTALHWLPGYRLQVASGNGTFKIYSEETPAPVVSGIQALKIFKADSSEYYYVSFRKALGLDSDLPAAITQGASIHLWDDNAVRQTRLLDTTPLSPALFSDSTLSDNQSFIDQLNGITVRQLSHNSSSVTVEVANAPPLPLGTVTGSYVDINDNLMELDSVASLSSLSTQTGGSSVLTPSWFFNKLVPGIYTISASPLPGYDIYYSYCINCSNHSIYLHGYIFNAQVPIGGFMDVRFKYVPAGTTLPRPSLPPGSD